jgi:hypothetical protein
MTSITDPRNTPYMELVNDLEAEGFAVRLDKVRGDVARVRVERHTGRTFYDYRETTESTAGYSTAVLRAWHKVQDAKADGEIGNLLEESIYRTVNGQELHQVARDGGQF